MQATYRAIAIATILTFNTFFSFALSQSRTPSVASAAQCRVTLVGVRCIANPIKD